MKNRINDIIFYIVLSIICIIMLLFIFKKEGFHEDEIFSYGSSNYKYDNLFQTSGDKDYINKTIDSILDSSEPIKSIIYYMQNTQEFLEEMDNIKETEQPVWKTNEQAKEYMTVQPNEILSFYSIYYNQSRDAHPPLFYFLVHIISSLVCNKFTKYIIFSINIIAFFISIIIMRKILKILNKSYLEIPTILLYGLSIGGITTVIFQRMYMLLTLFILCFIYLNIKIIINNFDIHKEDKIKLGITTILGFLTQYYFCIYALFIFIIMQIMIYKNKGKNEFKEYLLFYIKLAVIGIVIFPACIYHIFFSYRGITNASNQYSMFNFIELIFKAYNVPFLLGYLVLILFIIAAILFLKKNKDIIPITLLITTVGFVCIVSKISPYLELRYIMGILPIIAIQCLITIDYFIRLNKTPLIVLIIVIILIKSFYTLNVDIPLYLYEGYNENINIANQNYKLKYIYIIDNGFTHIQSLPEFMIYEQSLILDINKDELKYLKDNIELENENEIIVSIKRYMNTNNIISKVMEFTNFSKSEILLNGDNATGNIIYKLTR